MSSNDRHRDVSLVVVSRARRRGLDHVDGLDGYAWPEPASGRGHIHYHVAGHDAGHDATLVAAYAFTILKVLWVGVGYFLVWLAALPKEEWCKSLGSENYS